MNILKTYCLSLFLGLTLLNATAFSNNEATPQKGKLVFAIDVIRHGDRNPLINIPTTPHAWPEGLGQLTPIGMHQEYELGKKLHHRYVDQEKLLPKSYQPETLYVRSTNVDRTLMSAECFLMGLYPLGSGPCINTPWLMKMAALPYHYQPIPIHSVPNDQDSLRYPSNMTELRKKYVFSTSEWKSKEAELRPHFKAWSQATGIPLTSLNDLGLLSDTLFIDQLKHVPLPKNLTKDDVSTIIKESTSRFAIIFKNRTIGKATGGVLFREIAQHLEEAAQHKTSLKYILYSAHDGTILSLMSAMGVPLNICPHYASDLNIALFDRENHDYYVQVTFNDQAVQFPGISENRTSCSLAQFMALAKKSDH